MGWGRKSRSPYYNNRNALGLKKLIDAMIETRQEIHVPYIQEGNVLSPNSLYLKINQGIAYIVAMYDTEDKKYRHWREEIFIRRDNPTHIRIYFHTGGASPSGALVAMDTKDKIWIRDLEEWLESDSVEPYIKEDLTMTPEQAQKLLTELKELKGIEFSVGPTYIKAVKI